MKCKGRWSDTIQKVTKIFIRSTTHDNNYTAKCTMHVSVAPYAWRVRRIWYTLQTMATGMADYSEVVDVVLAHCCDLRTLLSLGASSKLVKSRCTSVVRQNFQQLLLAALKSCVLAPQSSVWLHMMDYEDDFAKALNSLRWLLRTGTPAAVGSDAMQQLLSMRHVPKECTAALVEAGVLPTWQQLVAAARSGHCMKQWLVACRRLVKPLPGLTALAEVALVAELDLLQPPSSSNLTQRMCQEQPSEDELVTVLHVALSTGTARCFLSLLSDKDSAAAGRAVAAVPAVAAAAARTAASAAVGSCSGAASGGSHT